MVERPRRNLLVEIGTEELPPKALKRLGETLGASLFEQIRQQGLLVDPDLPFRWFAAPRRLAVWVPAVRGRQPDQTQERRGPAVQAAFDADGKPTQAAVGFARSVGVDVDRLERLRSGKGEWLVHRLKSKGASAAELIPGCIAEAVRRLPIPKRMRWGDLEAEFVRPVHWLVILHGRSVIKTELLGVVSGARSRGHRFHTVHSIKLTSADDYEHQLEKEGMVIAGFAARRDRIRAQVKRLAKSVDGTAVIADDLLDEVTGLVEWPQAILGEFDEEFLKVPAEALISSMRDHQKYFHLVNERGRLQPYFITVSNIKSREPRRVRSGNERVLRARLSDARFFWETDRKRSLESRGADLEQVLFHKKLGSLADKTRRIGQLSEFIAASLGEDGELCQRAAILAKADLGSAMVAEFPELQGIMGRYYAQHDKEQAQVAAAIEEHYRPRFAGDTLPESGVGRVLALADRLDTLVGIFAAGEEPTGDKDPYGLRRAALGVLRLCIEAKVDIDLVELLSYSAKLYADCETALSADDDLVERVSTFLLDRLNSYYAGQGFGSDEIVAVAQRRPRRPLDFDRRLRAVAKFRKLAAADQLAAANKRIRNILRKADGAIPDTVDEKLLREPAERRLAAAMMELKPAVSAQFERGEYAQGLSRLAALRAPVDLFFDQVMVMAEEPALRRNRLALLQELQRLFLGVADISALQPEKK